MAVFTKIDFDEANAWLKNYSIGKCIALDPIMGGIENSNFFLTAEMEEKGEKRQKTFVLTIFENIAAKELPYYLNLTQHLGNKNLAVPKPILDNNDNTFSFLKGKPAAIVTKLPGKSIVETKIDHCASVGHVLAELHLASKDFNYNKINDRSLNWWKTVVPRIGTKVASNQGALNNASFTLLKNELTEQKKFFSSEAYNKLPTGHCHGDLFRDNVLFLKNSQGKDTISGIFDFYFAGIDKWLFDLAVCVNDWCQNNDGSLDPNRVQALCLAYQDLRPLEEAEITMWPMMLRTAAYRFWVSRLFDMLFPRPASALRIHDPNRFEVILKHHHTLGNKAKKFLFT